MIIKANSHLGFNCKALENTAQFYKGNRMEVQEYGAHSMQIYGKTGIWD